MKLGIDVGGTHTDAVILSDDGRLIGQAKQATGQDILSGIRGAVKAAIREASIEPDVVQGIFIGSTHILNALLHAKGLTDTALIRICSHPSRMRAGESWPETISRHIRCVEHLRGGYELDGSRRHALDFQELLPGLVEKIAQSGARAVAIAGTFSPLYHEEEQMLAEMIRQSLPGVMVTMSHQIGGLGYLQRENASLLNALLSHVMQDAINGLAGVMQELGFSCPYWFTQNDGSLMTLADAAAFPILTIASGVANSMRGASYLTGLKDCVVVDMGGSTTEVGIVSDGEPLELGSDSVISGIRLNVRLPKSTSLPFGGESRLGMADGEPKLFVQAEAGQTVRLTDLFLQLHPQAFPNGYARAASTTLLPKREAEALAKHVIDILRETIDRVQPVKDKLPVVLVGGGSPLLVDRLFFKYGDVFHPPGYPICNAIGACMAPVSARIDRIMWLDHRSKDEVLEEVKQELFHAVERSGARRESIRLVRVEEIPFDYYKGEVIRFRLKAVGQLGQHVPALR